MKTEQILQIVKTYELTQRLKTTLRRGWVLWHLENERIESIAEHVFGTCMLAVSIYAASPKDIDINKVITMLMLHETEEIIIGDLTPYDDRSNKAEDGRNAVLEIFKDYPNSQSFVDIIEEFEQNVTPEARFALQCDKLEANLYAFVHNKEYALDKVSSEIYNHTSIKAWRDEGYNTVAEWFVKSDLAIYSDDFLDIANYLLKNIER